MDNTNNVRIPRPLGYTTACINYENDPSRDNLDTKLNLLVAHYVNNNYTLSGTRLSIQDLAQKTRTNIETLQLYLYNYINKLYSIEHILGTGTPTPTDSPGNQLSHNNGGTLIPIQGSQRNKDNPIQGQGDLSPAQASIRLGMGALFQWSLGDRALIMEQVQRLAKAQGDGYKPFISGEYGKALKLLLETHSDMASLVNLVSGPKGQTIVNVLNQNEGPTTKENIQSDGLTTEAALVMISKNSGPQLLEDKEGLQALGETYDVENLPVVNAIEQGFEDSVPKIQKPIPKEVEGHINRRADELQVDLEEDHIG